MDKKLSQDGIDGKQKVGEKNETASGKVALLPKI